MNRLPHLTQFADRHLTDQQMFGLLDAPDDSDATTRLHLVGCPSCQSEFSTLRASLTNFRAAATSLASAEAPALASGRIARSIARSRPSRLRRNAWATSLATVAAFAIALPFMHSGHKKPAFQGSPVTSTTGVDSSAESDDALLDGIQRDLSTSIPPSLEPLAVPAASNSADIHN